MTADPTKIRKRAALFTGFLIGFVVFIWAENNLSQPFRACVAKEASYQSANNPNKSRFIIGRAFGREFICTVDFLDQHNGFVAALAGLAVAYFTLTLKIATDRLWAVSYDQAETAKRALTELERPFAYVRARFQLIELPSAYGGGHVLTPHSDHIDVTYVNVGRTPALLTRVHCVLSTAPRGGIVDPVNPGEIGGRELPVGIISEGTNPYVERESVIQSLDVRQRSALAADTESLWITGFIRYRDIFNANHITGFTMVHDRIGNRFIARGDHRYNYARTEKPEEIPAPSSRG